MVLGTAAAAAWLGWRDTTRPVLRTVSVEVPGLTREYRILQVTDLHGSTFGPAQKDVAALVAGRRFDAIVMTGDMILTRGETTAPAIELAEVLAPTSEIMVFTNGNHDDDTVGPALAGLGVHDLDATGPLRAGGLVLESRDPSEASVDDTGLRVVAVHSPPSPEVLAGMTAGRSTPTLVLSGHTHGGQLRLPFLGGVICPPTAQSDGRFLLFPELRGVRIEGAFRDGRTESYISPGLGSQTGFWLPAWTRFRWGERAELTEIIVHGPPVRGAK